MVVAALAAKHNDAVKAKHSVFSLVWDRLGVIMSGLCLIDCLVLPVVSTLLISLQSSVGWVKELHWYLLPVIGVTGGIAFHHSFKAHHAYSIVASGVIGYLMLAFGELFEAELGFRSINYVSVAGSALLISAHVRNLMMHNRGHANHEH